MNSVSWVANARKEAANLTGPTNVAAVSPDEAGGGAPVGKFAADLRQAMREAPSPAVAGGTSAATSVASSGVLVSSAVEVSTTLETRTSTVCDSFTAKVSGSDAGYNSSYGYYVTDDSGNPVSGQILFANVKNGGTATVVGVDPSHVGFFIIPNGASNNGDLANGQPVTFKQVDGQWTAVDAAGQAIAGSGANVLFDNQALNGDGIAHAKDTGAEGGNQNWEDLYNGGDADYNDVSVNVAWGGADTAITDNVLMETSRIDTVVISQYTVTVQTTGTVSATASESNGGDSGLALPQRLSLHFGELRNQLDPNRALTDAERGRGDHDHDSGGGA